MNDGSENEEEYAIFLFGQSDLSQGITLRSPTQTHQRIKRDFGEVDRRLASELDDSIYNLVDILSSSESSSTSENSNINPTGSNSVSSVQPSVSGVQSTRIVVTSTGTGGARITPPTTTTTAPAIKMKST